MSEAVKGFPPVVYVPCASVPPNSSDVQSSGNPEVVVDTRKTKDGRTALLVYSALDRLIDSCGSQQPWVVMPTKNLDKVDQEIGVDLILLDIYIPEDRRRAGE